MAGHQYLQLGEGGQDTENEPHKSFKRTAILDQVVAHRLPGTSTTRWNFHSRPVNTVYEHKENILRCFQTIRDSGDFDPITMREAGGFVRMMEDEVFSFFLTLFHKIMPHVDMLFSQLQKRNIDSRFTSSIQTIRDSIPSGEISGSVQQLPTKKRRALGHEEQQLLARELTCFICAMSPALPLVLELCARKALTVHGRWRSVSVSNNGSIFSEGTG
ncbi:hypothetical protein F7725_013468 [Dissostichus mawsoni]|uniref:Uncharacterized protein n=1 Tax=Dissostichus mawsoni TaxID=36200 RepID=A0A7J5YQA8_DISMA|nr:hypothetical protein F7725_013468 [Dissostichus mawsoni]